jgi:hypothetical protein
VKGVSRTLRRVLKGNAEPQGTLNHYFLYRDLMTPDGRVVATHGERLLTSFVEMMTLEQGFQPAAHRPTQGERDKSSQ